MVGNITLGIPYIILANAGYAHHHWPEWSSALGTVLDPLLNIHHLFCIHPSPLLSIRDLDGVRRQPHYLGATDRQLDLKFPNPIR